ncbi:GAF domain-containing protein [Yoonia sp. R2331]|uniref:GAF domain-containing protein n=1 Tax=Yoonia sp. R2331 TaxID=3237238 RepID=UPI0034E4C47D
MNKCASVLLDVLDCDNAYVNIQSEKLFYSLGNLPEVVSGKLQTHDMKDTLCMHTFASNETLRLENAAANDTYRDTAYVKNGGIVGYLGVPISVKDCGPIGTICVTTKTPREWTEVEQELVIKMAACVETALELQRSEVMSEALSEALSELDQVLIVLAMAMTDAVSIYDRDSKLVFASKALSNMVGYSEIAEAAKLVDAPTFQHEDSFDGQTAFRHRLGQFSVAVRPTNTEHLIFSWAAGSLS